jgi:hypothetical protein
MVQFLWCILCTSITLPLRFFLVRFSYTTQSRPKISFWTTHLLCVLKQTDSKLPIDMFENVMQLAIEGCKVVANYIQEVIKNIFLLANDNAAFLFFDLVWTCWVASVLEQCAMTSTQRYCFIRSLSIYSHEGFIGIFYWNNVQWHLLSDVGLWKLQLGLIIGRLPLLQCGFANPHLQSKATICIYLFQLLMVPCLWWGMWDSGRACRSA